MPGKEYHQKFTIRNWKKYGVKSDDYKKLYEMHINKKNCELCNVLFDKTYKNQRCLDHDHNTGLYRKTLCRSCNASYIKAPQKLKINNTTGHMFLTNSKTKNKSGNYSFTWRYQRKINDDLKIRKSFKTKIEAIVFSAFMMMKYPLN